MTPELWGPEDRKVIGLAGCQTSFRERPCLKGIRQRHPTSPSGLHICTHRDTQERERILTLFDVIQKLPDIGFLGARWSLIYILTADLEDKLRVWSSEDNKDPRDLTTHGLLVM